MKRFGSLKKLKFEILNIGKNRRSASVIAINEAPTNDEISPDIGEEKTKVNFRNLLHSSLCMNEENEVSKKKTLNYLKNVFAVHVREAEKIREEVEAELKIYKYENIMEHSMLLIEVSKHESSETESSVLSSHAKFKHLNETEVEFAKWISMNMLDDSASRPKMKSRAFGQTIEKLTEYKPETRKFHLKTDNENIEREFLTASESFLRKCLEFIENLTGFEGNLDLSSLIKAAVIINECKKDDPDANATFVELIKESLTICVTNLLHRLETNFRFKEEDSIDKKLEGMHDFASETNKTYKQMVKAFQEPFQQLTLLNTNETLFKIFDKHLWNHFQPAIAELCKRNISPLNRNEFNRNEEMFQLFLEMKAFSNKGLKAVTNLQFHTIKFADWFSNEADHTCDCPLLSVTPRIAKALSMENYVTVDEMSNHSNTAVDIVGLLDLVIKFWVNEKKSQRLKLQDETPIKFIKFVTSDVCRLVVVYLNTVFQLIKDFDCSKTYRLMTNACVIINNLNFVEKNLQSLIVAFILKTDNSSIKLPNAVRRTLRFCLTKKLEIFEKVSTKAASIIKKQLIDETCELSQLHLKVDELLRKELTKADCSNLRTSFHKAIIKECHNLMTIDEEIRSSNTICRHLKICLENIERTSKAFDDDDVSRRFTIIEDLLRYSSLSTKDLICEFYLDRYKQQQSRSTVANDPALSVECYFTDKHLFLNIWHGKNLVDAFDEPFDSYVKIRFVPGDDYPTFQDMKTKVFKKAPFPLYEECFQKEFTHRQRHMKNAIILFTVMDKSIINQNTYIGEALLAFADIEDCTHNKRQSAKHIYLPLSKLGDEDMPALNALQQRSEKGDELAAEFLRKVCSISNQPSPSISPKIHFEAFMKKLPAAAVKIGKKSKNKKNKG